MQGFLCPATKKVAGYYVIPSDILSVCPSVRPSVVHHRVRSITLIPFEIISQNLVEISRGVVGWCDEAG